MIRRPPRSTPLYSSAASDVYKRQDKECETFAVKRCPASAASCTCRQQGRLLQHSAGWGFQITPASSPVSDERCCSVGVLGEAVRTRDATSPGTPLVKSSRKSQVPTQYLANTVQLTSGMTARRHLRSAAISTLVVPSTHRSTLGDRAFPVAAARAWNLLPSSLRAVPSRASFRLLTIPSIFL